MRSIGWRGAAGTGSPSTPRPLPVPLAEDAERAARRGWHLFGVVVEVE
jgi:hypothetical protein